MLRCPVRMVTRIGKAIARAVTAFARRIAMRLRRAWKFHGERVATDAVYAEVTATVLAGLLGLIPVKDVLSTISAAVFGGVCMNDRRRQTRATPRWSDNWGFA
jgi:hypothetical protein